MTSLCIQLQKAQNLRAVDSNGYSDPYCEIEIVCKKKKTLFKSKTIKKCLNPNWEEKFILPNFSESDIPDTSIKFTIWNWTFTSFLGVKDSNLGFVQLSQEKMKAIGKKETIFEEELIGGYGSVFFVLNIEDKAVEKKSSMVSLFGAKLDTKKVTMIKDDSKSPRDGGLDRQYSGYEVNFYSVFTEVEMKEGFMKHLETEYNTQPFEFLLEVKEIENMYNVTEKDLEKFHNIVNTYVKAKSSKEVNISGKARNSVLSIAEKNQKEWKEEKSPLEVIEPARAEIFKDLRFDSFPRFISSDFGFSIIEKNSTNPMILTKDPAQTIYYKLLELFGDKMDRIEMKEQAKVLASEERLKSVYFSEKLLKGFKLNNLKVKVFLVESGSKNRLNQLKKGGADILSPTTVGFKGMDADVCSYYLSLMIGPFVLEWNESELCIPKTCIDVNLVNVDVPAIGYVKDLNLNALAKFVCTWNIEKKYRISKTYKDNGNSQDFIDDALQALGLVVKNVHMNNLFNEIRTYGSTDLKIKFDKDFGDRFDISVEEPMIFKDHAQLDKFVNRVISMDPLFVKKYFEEYDLLKLYDRLFWTRYSDAKNDIQPKEKELKDIENLIKEKCKSDDFTNKEKEELFIKQNFAKQELSYAKSQLVTSKPLHEEVIDEEDGEKYMDLACPFKDPSFSDTVIQKMGMYK